VNPNDIIAAALKNPATALHELERMDCEESLYDFVRHAWHTLHPGTPFVGGWAIETVCRHLEAVTRGDIDKLLINIPPGCTKSMLVNVFWPAWEWGPKGLGHYQYISASYEKGLAIRDLVYGRDLIKSEWYQSHWPTEFKKDDDGKSQYTTNKRGWRFAASVGSGLTGRRGHRFIIDDPHSVGTAESETERATARFWFSETTPTRFVDQKRPVYVVIMQRLHEADISGVIIEKLFKDGWTHLVLPMEAEPEFASYTSVPVPGQKPERMRRIKDEGEPLPYYVKDPEGDLLYCQDPRKQPGELLWPERFDIASIDSLKLQFSAEGGSYAVACQLQQRPVPRGGGMFQKKDFGYLDSAPVCSRIVRGWDLAATKDGHGAYTVGLKLGETSTNQLVILDVVRFRGSSYEVEQEMLRCAKQDGCPQSIPQDPGQAGKAQKAHLAGILSGYDLHFSTESGEKADRARPLSAQSEAGNLFMVRAPWNDALVAELCLFPNGTFKDQADAGSRAYDYLLRQDHFGIALTPGIAVT